MEGISVATGVWSGREEKHGYFTGYNRHGAFYILAETPAFDDHGLWVWQLAPAPTRKSDPHELSRWDMLHRPFVKVAFFSGFMGLEELQLVRIGG